MDAYASIYPGIDLLPTRLPHVDRHGHAWCVACHGRNGRAVAGDGLCDTCRGFNHCKPEHRRIAYGHGLVPCECHRCGQRLAVPPAAARICEPCRGLERQPQGEAVRLFTPAPTEIPGQLAL
jgi:DnaJ-class molecular chaperone